MHIHAHRQAAEAINNLAAPVMGEQSTLEAALTLLFRALVAKQVAMQQASPVTRPL
jgi:hypothetical protein